MIITNSKAKIIEQLNPNKTYPTIFLASMVSLSSSVGISKAVPINFSYQSKNTQMNKTIRHHKP